MSDQPKETTVVERAQDVQQQAPAAAPEKQLPATTQPLAEAALTMVRIVERVTTNPNFDIEKMKEIVKLQEQIFNKNAEIAFNAAMSRAQAKMEPVARDAFNDQTRSSYSKLETICEKITPIYTAEGFALSFESLDCPREGPWLRVGCEITHAEGFVKKRYVDLPVDDKGMQGGQNKTVMHGIGSTYSYGRRYLMLLIFNIPMKGEDDDGNAGGGKAAQQRREPQRRQQQGQQRKGGGKSQQSAAPQSGSKPIQKGQVNVLKSTLERKGKSIEEFCGVFNVRKLEELPFEKMNKALDWANGK